jgi:hypothetical protein
MLIKVPENLSEITIEQFIKYNRIINLPDLEENSKMIFIVSLFCNIDVAKIGILEISKVRNIANQLIEVLNSEPRQIFEFGKFGFIPNFDTISASEYIDIDTYIYDIELANKAMAVLFRPIEKKMNGMRQIEKYKGSDVYAQEMLNAPLEAYLSAKVFFWNLSKALLTSTKQYFLEQTTQTQELQMALVKSGSGMHQFIQLLEEAFLNLEKQLNYQFTSF